MFRHALIALMIAMTLPAAQAGAIEDAFRSFIDNLKSRGQPIAEFRLGPFGFSEVRVPELDERVDQLPLGRQHYAVFVTPGCRGCEAAVSFLRSRNLAYEVLDVSRSTTAREAYALVQGRGFPVVLLGHQRMTGWSERLHERALINETQREMQRVQGQGA